MDMPGNVFKQLLQQRCLQIGLFVGLASAYSMEILATSMSYLGESGHAEVKAAIDDALKRVAATGMAAGVFVTDPLLAQHYRDCGASFIAVGGDTSRLRNAAVKLAPSFPRATGGTGI